MSLIQACPHCGKKNRIPVGRDNMDAKCGHCSSLLHEENFEAEAKSSFNKTLSIEEIISLLATQTKEALSLGKMGYRLIKDPYSLGYIKAFANYLISKIEKDVLKSHEIYVLVLNEIFKNQSEEIRERAHLLDVSNLDFLHGRTLGWEEAKNFLERNSKPTGLKTYLLEKKKGIKYPSDVASEKLSEILSLLGIVLVIGLWHSFEAVSIGWYFPLGFVGASAGLLGLIWIYHYIKASIGNSYNNKPIHRSNNEEK